MNGLNVLAAMIVPLLTPRVTGGAPATLDAGYRLMYGLDFDGAKRAFQQWQADHPEDPRGPTSEAVSLLFAELERGGTLVAQFRADAQLFAAGMRRPAPAGLRERFDGLLGEAESLARRQLQTDPRNPDALFAMAMVNGLRADYAALIEGRAVAALARTREAVRSAQALLEVAPEFADAHLAIGITHYVAGSLNAPLRWALRLAGLPGSREQAVQDLWATAERGRFLSPFARILLAVVYLRDHNTAPARGLLAGLAREFPSNPLFARELHRLDAGAN